MKRLDVGLFRGPVAQTPGDTLVVVVPEDERPLGGDAGRVDWRLCGEISAHLKSGYLSGRAGEAVLLPGDRRLDVSRLLLLGAGPSDQLSGRALPNVIRTAAERLMGLRTENAALALPGAVDLEADASAILLAFARALGESRTHAFLRIVFPDAARWERALERGFGEAFPHAQARGVELTAHHVERDRPAPNRPPGEPPAPQPSV